MTHHSMQFKMHPSLISSIINEQSGKPEKALAELVMNSVDAGATQVHITLSAKRYTVQDNGSGFSGLEEIEKFFGTFGTPHYEGDGAKFGRFRMGRGVAFSMSKTEWRSGMYGMTVNLGGLSRTDMHGYELHEYTENYEGCLIEGEFYQALSSYAGLHSATIFDEKFNADLKAFAEKPSYEIMQGNSFCHSLLSYICMMDVEIYINGIRVSHLLKYSNNIYSSALADIYTENTARGLVLMNQGVYIQTIPFAAPFIIDFKKAPALNMARNQLDANCPIYQQVKQEFFDFLVKSYVKGQKFSAKVEKILFNYVNNDYSHFEREFIDAIVGEKLLQVLGVYQVFKVTATSVEKISFLQACDLIAEQKVCLSKYGQCSGLTAAKAKVFQNQLSLSKETASEVHILDLNRLMISNGYRSLGSKSLRLLLSNSGRNIDDLTVYENDVIDQFSDLKTGRITSRHLREKIQNDDSLLEVFNRVDSLWDGYIGITKKYFLKKEKYMKEFELDIKAYIQNLRDFYVEVTGGENPQINLFKDLRIIPLVVDEVCTHYTVLAFFELTEKEICLLISRKYIGNFMHWMDKLNHFLFSTDIGDAEGGEGEEKLYADFEMNMALHDEVLSSGACTSLYHLARELGLKVVKNFEVNKAIVGNTNRLEETKAAWEKIFEVKPALLDRSGVEQARQAVAEFGGISN